MAAVEEKQATGFFGFIRKYNAIPLAIGVVLGTAVNDVVKALVDGIIMPLVSLINPSNALQTLSYQVGEATFKVGDVVSAVISFLAIALTVYFLAKVVLRNAALLGE